MAEAHRRLAPVVTGGLAAAGLAAVAGNQAWAAGAGSTDGNATDPTFATAAVSTVDATAPPVTALALVLLATWGVVLVARGRWRVGVTWLGLLAAVGVAGFAVVAWFDTPSALAQDLAASPALTTTPEVSRTVWSFLGVLAGLAAVGASALATRSVAGWPEMGRRYDAPGEQRATRRTTSAVPLEEQTNLDLWRAIDEGRDPTQGPGRPGPLD